MTTYRANPVPITATELVPPVDCPAVRPSFDGFSLARRLDSTEDRSYNKRARVARGRDEESRGRISSKRDRDVGSSSNRPRDRSVARKGSVSADSGTAALDWIKLDHEKLAKRAQALAKTRNQIQDLAQNPALGSSSNSNSTGEVRGQVQIQKEPQTSDVNSRAVKLEVPNFSPITSRSNQDGSIQLTPSTLNLSGINLNNSATGEAMETDEVENELLGIETPSVQTGSPSG